MRPPPGSASAPWCVRVKREHGCAGTPSGRGVIGFVACARSRAGEGWRSKERDEDPIRARRDVDGPRRARAARAAHRRRPAQVFYRLRDGWDVGMSKPSAFTVPPPPREKVRQEGFEPSYPGPVESQLPSEHRVRRRVPVTSPSGRPDACTDAAGQHLSDCWGFTDRAREHPTRRPLLRHPFTRVNRKRSVAVCSHARHRAVIGGACCWRMTKLKLVLLVALAGCGGDDVELALDAASAADLARAFCKREMACS